MTNFDVQDDRVDTSKFDIFTETEKKELFELFDQKNEEYHERIKKKNMTKEEKIEEFEKFDMELEQIFAQFRERALKRQQNT